MFSIWFQIIIINGHCGPAIKWEFGCLMPFAYDDDLCCGQTLALDATQMHFCCSIYGAWWDCENVAAYNLVVMACTHANAFGPFCPAHCPASLPPEFHSSYKYFIFFHFFCCHVNELIGFLLAQYNATHCIMLTSQFSTECTMHTHQQDDHRWHGTISNRFSS